MNEDVGVSGDARSELACPVCGRHTLALDEPPRIDVMGVQLYSDIVGMGDLKQQGPVGIVCLSCGTRWRDKDAFDRDEPLAEDQSADLGAADDLEGDDLDDDLEDAGRGA